MNLRKTIAGAAVTLGGAAVLLGLGGTAQAAELGAHTTPDVEGELGRIATVGDIVRVDTADPAGPVVLGPVAAGQDAGALDVRLEILGG